MVYTTSLAYNGGMSESRSDKRVLFLSGKQNLFMEEVLRVVDIKKAAKLCSVSERTIRDWRREKFLMSYGSYKKLCNKAEIILPVKVKLQDRYWYTKKGGIIGGRVVYRKYGIVGGSPEIRKVNWRRWWNEKGRYKSVIGKSKPVKMPKISVDLAEFFGIMMGDGGMTKSQMMVTLNKDDDKLYVSHVISLMKKLFEIEPSVHDVGSVTRISISRVELVKFCHSLGLKIGHKINQNLDVPDWIKKSNQFKKACIRGLFDTDGCVYQEVHKVGGKTYSYIRLAFSSASPHLRLTILESLECFGFHPKFRPKRNIQLESKLEIVQYFASIGTSNPKHQVRYNEFIGGVG